MADVIHLSSLLLSSLNNLQQPLFHTRNSLKRVDFCNKSLVFSVAPFPLSKAPQPSLKVHAVVAEATDQPKWWEKNAGPNMMDIHSTEEFLSTLSEAGDRLVIAEFYGTWCASCRALFPKLCKTAAEHPEILFLKVNFDENKAMCKSMNVKVLPYFHFYHGAAGKVDAFSCSLAKFQKIKDGIEMHNQVSSPAKADDELSPDSPPSVEDSQSETSNT